MSDQAEPGSITDRHAVDDEKILLIVVALARFEPKLKTRTKTTAPTLSALWPTIEERAQSIGHFLRRVQRQIRAEHLIRFDTDLIGGRGYILFGFVKSFFVRSICARIMRRRPLVIFVGGG